MDSIRLTRAQIVKAVGSDQQTIRTFERLVAGAVPVRLVEGDTTLTVADRVVVMTDGGTATLPRASVVVGQMLTVKRTGGATTVAASGTDLIDGGTTYSLASANDAVTVVSTGAAWLTV